LSARTAAGYTEGRTAEGVARCPDCGLYFSVEAALPELENYIEPHDCGKEEMRYMPWQL